MFFFAIIVKTSCIFTAATTRSYVFLCYNIILKTPVFLLLQLQEVMFFFAINNIIVKTRV